MGYIRPGVECCRVDSASTPQNTNVNRICEAVYGARPLYVTVYLGERGLYYTAHRLVTVVLNVTIRRCLRGSFYVPHAAYSGSYYLSYRVGSNGGITQFGPRRFGPRRFGAVGHDATTFVSRVVSYAEVGITILCTSAVNVGTICHSLLARLY